MNIPTAEEILDILLPNKVNASKEENEDSLKQNIEVLKDWVKLHCQEQARVISKLDFEDLPQNELANDFEENRELAIINDYDLNLIKCY